MTDELGDLVTEQARVDALRTGLGGQLASVRTQAGISQPQLAHALSRTRSFISKVEHGVRRMPEALWKIADELCDAHGELITSHSQLTQAEADYRTRCRASRRQAQSTSPSLDARHNTIWSPVGVGPAGHGDVVWPPETLVSGKLAQELMAVVAKLARLVGRREAIRLAGSVLAAVGLSDLDSDGYMRVAQAVKSPRRIDAQVIDNFRIMLAVCKRQEDTLGPREVLDTVKAQHAIVRRLIVQSDCPDKLRKPLHLVDSTMAATIGGYLNNMLQPEAASRYFAHARKAAHYAGNPTCAAYAAINASFVAFQRGDTPTALDTAAAARSLATRTGDPRLKALAEEQAAGAYALDKQHTACMRACDRAHDFLTTVNGSAPDSPAYWVHEGTLGSKTSTFLTLLGKPREAVEAAHTAQARINHTTYIHLYARCQVRLGHALALSHDINEAARVLVDITSHASLSSRLTHELHTARALMQPWAATHAIKTLDDQLRACGLLSSHPA